MEKCKWIFRKQVSTGEMRYIVGCNKKKFSDLHGFVFCPYCGKEIDIEYKV